LRYDEGKCLFFKKLLASKFRIVAMYNKNVKIEKMSHENLYSMICRENYKII